MGILIRINDAAFTRYIDMVDISEEESVIPTTYPVTSTLKGLYYLAGTAEACLADHSGNENNAALTGSITVTDGYATFDDIVISNRMDTPVLTSPENKTTVVALFRVPSGIRHIASTFANNKGGFAFTNDRAYINAVVDGTGSGVSKTFTALNSENFTICAWSVDANVCRVVKDADGSIAELLNYTGENICNWENAVIIGGGYSNLSMNATADIALVSIHEGEITDEQLQQIFAYVRKYGEGKGLIID